ncbi:hypothetical protein ACLQ3D_10305 [Micromonospora vinacea]|uniref:hypothetical protein n=1 Tax=Micromonospora TaxID=1873 RepID=UPI002ED5B240|nr:hypothetical protein OHB44_23120 [Micromonospora sp. NBC_00821]
MLIVEPGPFRTDFLGRSITMADNVMPECAAGSRKHYRAVDADEAPLYLRLGPIAHSVAERSWLAFRSDIDAWCDIMIATDFDQPLSAGGELCVNVNISRLESDHDRNFEGVHPATGAGE